MTLAIPVGWFIQYAFYKLQPMYLPLFACNTYKPAPDYAILMKPDLAEPITFRHLVSPRCPIRPTATTLRACWGHGAVPQQRLAANRPALCIRQHDGLRWNRHASVIARHRWQTPHAPSRAGTLHDTARQRMTHGGGQAAVADNEMQEHPDSLMGIT